MAKNAKFDCIEKWVKANPEYKIYEFPNDKDSRSYVVVWQTDIKKYWGFFEDGAHAFYNVSSLGKKPMKIGKWECDGTDNFMFTSGIDVGGYPASPKAYYSKDKFVEKEIPQQPEQTTEPGTTDLENLFACIENYFKARGVQIETYSDARKVNITPTSTWIFYRPNSDNRQRWIEYENNKVIGRGDWACDGESNFTIKKDGGETFSSQTDDSDTQSEPTYDKSKFPLKLDSRGPEVVQLQNYLNKLIPMDPLVVNGIFNKKTQDKLIQLQKNLNLTK